MKKITVTDVTLKVAEEVKSFTFREKLNVCALIDGMGVDAIELPALSGSEENAVICRTIADSVKNAAVAIEVGSDENGVERAYECVKGAAFPALTVSLPVSTATMEYGYHLKGAAMLEKIKKLVSRAKAFCDDVRFVARDAFRAEQGFIEQAAIAATQSGATSITVCDDAGEAFPAEYAVIVKKIKGVSNAAVVVQPSDNLSLATACAIEAIAAGADGVKTTVIGNGLRSDVVADVFRAKFNELGATVGIDVTSVKTIAKNISSTSESAVARETETKRDVLSSAASLKEVSAAVKELGYELTDKDTGKVYDEFKKVAAQKQSVEVKELEAIVASTAMQAPSTYHLVNYVVNSGSIIPATANVTLEKNGESFCGVSTGDGPIDAAFHAIEQVIGHHYELDDFQVHAVTKGREAVGSSIIRLRANGKLYPGNGVSTDIVGACIRAYVNALNKIVYEEN